jgi:hypothetical protein
MGKRERMAGMIVHLLALAMLVQDNQRPASLGSALYAHCQEAVRILDNPRAGGDLQSATECTAYIDGFTDALSFPGVCVNGASVATITRVYVAYMQKNPKLMDDPKSLGLLESLRNAYPCHK